MSEEDNRIETKKLSRKPIAMNPKYHAGDIPAKRVFAAISK